MAIKVLLHLPKQGRHVRQKINGVYLHSEEYDLHLYNGQPLTVEEFNKVAAKQLLADSHYIRPTVTILVEEDSDKEAAPPLITEAELKDLLESNATLRAQNGVLQTALDEIETKLKQPPALPPDSTPEVVTEPPDDATPPEPVPEAVVEAPAPKPKPAPAKKAVTDPAPKAE